MSQINGDKSRFHRERKQNIQRRIRTRELLEAAGKPVSAAPGEKKTKPAPVK
jgi:tRNA A37 N6-isopentenylltransferase MiaA